MGEAAIADPPVWDTVRAAKFSGCGDVVTDGTVKEHGWPASTSPERILKVKVAFSWPL
jgi:hypothetical protein